MLNDSKSHWLGPSKNVIAPVTASLQVTFCPKLIKRLATSQHIMLQTIFQALSKLLNEWDKIFHSYQTIQKSVVDYLASSDLLHKFHETVARQLAQAPQSSKAYQNLSPIPKPSNSFLKFTAKWSIAQSRFTSSLLYLLFVSSNRNSKTFNFPGREPSRSSFKVLEFAIEASISKPLKTAARARRFSLVSLGRVVSCADSWMRLTAACMMLWAGEV